MTLEAIAAEGLLRTYTDAGVFEAADVHVAQRLTALAGEPDERVALAVGLLVRALRGGSVCVDLRVVRRTVQAQLDMAELPWPDTGEWMAAVRASPLLGAPPVLRLFGDLLYLDRYWLEEEQVCADLLALSVPGARGDVPAVERLF
ncbi:MAG: exodeoxyribonuclease V subunit alpha, partial [Mycobacterium sp.]